MADLTLEASEQRAILENPEGVMLLMNWHDYQQTCADAMGAECNGNQLRHDELKAHGRAIVLKDPEIWSDEVLRAFGVTRAAGVMGREEALRLAGATGLDPDPDIAGVPVAAEVPPSDAAILAIASSVGMPISTGADTLVLFARALLAACAPRGVTEADRG